MKETVTEIMTTVCYVALCIGITTLVALSVWVLATKVWFGCVV